MTAARLLAFVGAGLALGSLVVGCGAPSGEPFVEEVIEVRLGQNAGFGEEDMVLGPPEGGGELSGSLDVLSLGQGGVIVVRLGTPAIDGEGVDVIVFENAFRFSGGIFQEPAQVSVSVDGQVWETFPCDGGDGGDDTLEGCASRSPVYAHPDNGISPRDPDVAGGDAFDLADVGLREASFVRIEDVSSRPASDLDNSGFELDAVAAVHTYVD